MSEKIDPALQDSIDKVVASFHAGKTDQEALEAVQNWLETDAWELLTADMDDGLAVNVEALADHFFNDDYAVSVLDVDEEELTDEARIQVGRDRFNEVLEDCSESFVDSLHCYEIVASNGQRASLTGVIEVMGQGGPEVFWTGLVKDREQFLEDIKKKGVYWIPLAWGAIADDEILSRWKK